MQANDNNDSRTGAQAMQTAIEQIAEKVLLIDTLTVRRSDSLDFSDQHVSTIKEALEAAYRAGQESRESQSE